ncbi:MAG: ABC transporter ATP-binding protein [Candidatus Bathyarchaeia archaeon]|nr:ABC transporter ATP-binding protein [Candidatus Bathyarchaeota archaeon]
MESTISIKLKPNSVIDRLRRSPLITFTGRYIWPRSKLVLTIVSALWIIQSLIFSYQGLILKYLIDDVASYNTTSLLYYLAMLAGTATGIIAIDYYSNLALWVRINYMVASIRSRMLGKLLFSDKGRSIPPGTAIARILSDVEFLIGNLMSIYPSIALHLSGLVSVLATLVFVSPRLLLVVSCFLPFNLAAYIYYIRRVPKARRVERELYGAVTESARSTIENLDVIGSFHVEKLYYASFRRLVSRWRGPVVAMIKSERIYWILNRIAIHFGPIAGVGIGAILAFRGEESVGSIASVASLSPSLYWSTTWLLWCLSVASQLSPVAVRVNEVLESEVCIEARESIRIDEVKLEEVSYSVDGRVVLQPLTISLKRGERIAVIGPAESGKSTLARIIAGIIEPSSGRIVVNGSLDTPRHILRSRVTLVSEGDRLIPGTIRENITLRRSIPSEELERVLNIVELRYDKYQSRLDTRVGEQNFSIPETDRCKIIVARGLISRPDILVIHNLFTNFDSETETRIVSKIADYLKDSTIIVVNAKPTTLRYVDRVIVLDHGRVIGDGRFDDIYRLQDIRETIDKLYGLYTLKQYASIATR